MRRFFALLPVAVLLWSSTSRAGDDLLGQVRQQLDAPGDPDPKGKREKDKKGDGNDECDDGLDLDLGLGPILGEALFAPFVVPARALRDDYQTYSLFPHYPYAGELTGDLWLDKRAEGEDKPHGLHGCAVEASLEDGYDFRGVNRVGIRLFLDTTFRLGVSTDWDFFTERRPGGGIDELTLGDANLTFRFAQSEWMEMYVGIGGRLTPERSDTRGGFNFTYGGQAFPCKPVVLASSLDLGTLGSASVVRVRGTVGLIHRHWELFGGYDYLRIGNVDLQGPMAGLRLWF